MSMHPAAGERPESDAEDEHRQAQTERLYFGKLVERLLATGAKDFPATRDFLQRMDLSLNVMRQEPNRADIVRVKQIAWDWRREMRGSALAPKLNPNDPIVREMGGG
jgi:hypothetical protein